MPPPDCFSLFYIAVLSNLLTLRLQLEGKLLPNNVDCISCLELSEFNIQIALSPHEAPATRCLSGDKLAASGSTAIDDPLSSHCRYSLHKPMLAFALQDIWLVWSLDTF
jgi:hypothetical protein